METHEYHLASRSLLDRLFQIGSGSAEIIHFLRERRMDAASRLAHQVSDYAIAASTAFKSLSALDLPQIWQTHPTYLDSIRDAALQVEISAVIGVADDERDGIGKQCSDSAATIRASLEGLLTKDDLAAKVREAFIKNAT